MSPERARTVGTSLLALAIVGSALAVGGVDTPVLLVTLVVASAAVVVLYARAEAHVPRWSASLVLWLGVALVAFTALQIVPLPRAVVSWASPHAADVWERCLRPLSEGGPAWITLSLDPSATKVELAKGATYVAVLLASLRVARRREGARMLERALVVSAILLAVVTAVHLGLGMERLYGFYKPLTGVGTIAPMFNANHLAGYMNVGLLVALGSALSDEPIAPKPLVLAGVVVLVAAEMWIASRGAVAAMLIGVAIVATRAFRRGRRSDWSTVAGVVGGVLVVGVVAILVFPFTISLLGDRDFSKLHTPVRVLGAMMPKYAVFGAGRGAFESTFAEFREGKGFLVWSHPENIEAQLVSEWGAPAALAAFCVLGWALRPRVLGTRTGGAVGAWAALVALLVHNQVDFNSEIPAVGIAGAACVGIVVAGTSARHARVLDGWASRPRGVALAFVLATAVILVVVWRRGGELLTDREALRQAAITDGETVESFRDDVRRAMLDHPAEPYFPYIAAVRFGRTREESVMPWIERTLERAPVYPFAHLVLARSIRRKSPSQARLEYRVYAEQSGGPVLDVAEVAPLVASFEDALELAPEGSDGDVFLDTLSQTIEPRLPATSARIDAYLDARAIPGAGQRLRQARRAYLDARDSPWCAVGDSCIEAAVVAAVQVETEAPDVCDGYALHARALALRGDSRGALEALRRGHVARDRVACQLQLIDLALELGKMDDATTETDTLARLPCPDAVTKCTDNLRLAANIEAKRGNGTRAYMFARRAHDADPDSEILGAEAAGRASAAGLHVESAAMYDELARRHPSGGYFALALRERGQIGLVP